MFSLFILVHVTIISNSQKLGGSLLKGVGGKVPKLRRSKKGGPLYDTGDLYGTKNLEYTVFIISKIDIF